jgi:hypothetical protein
VASSLNQNIEEFPRVSHTHIARMPRVHFANTNIFYSPPLTPSPTYSSASLPSSSGPDTPPPRQSGSPYPFTPEALSCEPIDPSVLIHPVLGLFNPPLINHDLTVPPDSIRTHDKKDLPERVLTEPATDPPMPFLTLTCDALPWSLKIPASSTHVDAFVTVSDVFNTLHYLLRLPVTPLEFSSIPTPEHEIAVIEAFQKRYRKYHADRRAYETEKSKGVKRVDFLMGKNRFMGLASTPRGPDVWALHVAP